MKIVRHAVVAAALVAALDASGQQAQKILVEKSEIRFVSRQMNVAVEGRFRKFDGTVAFDPANPEATKAQFEVDTASIDLGSPEGEEEVRDKGWFNVAAFPKATFSSSTVKSMGPGKFEARGKLTIKGTSVDIVAPFILREAPGQRVVEGQFPMKRLQFRIGEGPWSDTDTVADEVLVRFRFALPANR
jgi:polyisoprenoid-binding protein YceI